MMSIPIHSFCKSKENFRLIYKETFVNMEIGFLNKFGNFTPKNNQQRIAVTKTTDTSPHIFPPPNGRNLFKFIVSCAKSFQHFKTHSPMVKHIVMFRLEGEGRDCAAREFKAAIEAPPEKIDQLLTAEVGINDLAPTAAIGTSLTHLPLAMTMPTSQPMPHIPRRLLRCHLSNPSSSAVSALTAAYMLFAAFAAARLHAAARPTPATTPR